MIHGERRIYLPQAILDLSIQRGEPAGIVGAQVELEPRLTRANIDALAAADSPDVHRGGARPGDRGDRGDHGCDRVDRARGVGGLPRVAPGPADHDPPAHRPDTDRRDATEVVPFDGDEGHDRPGRVHRGRRGPREGCRTLPRQRSRAATPAHRADRATRRPRERGQPDGVVAYARADEPIALDAHGVGHVDVEHRVEMGAEHHDRSVAAAHQRPDVAGRVGPHVAQPVGLPPRSRPRPPGPPPLRSERERAAISTVRVTHGVSDVAHDASATPSATRASTSARPYPSSASTSNVCSPSAGAGAA